MKLHQIRIFESVARHLNVTSAADELHMSQPAVSIQLRRLEEDYGRKFYESNNHGVRLTNDGLKFLDAIQPILTQIQCVDMTFRSVGCSPESHVLRMGANHTLAVTVLPEILKNFKTRYPNVQIILETAESRTVESWVQDAKIEIALINKPSYFPNCVYRPHQEQEHETLAFVPVDSEITSRHMSLEQLTQYPLVVRGGSIGVEELIRRGFRLKLALQCHAPDAVKTAVQGGLGVGLLLRDLVKDEITQGQFRAINVPELRHMTLKSFIIYSTRQALSSRAKDFLQACIGAQPLSSDADEPAPRRGRSHRPRPFAEEPTL